MKKGIDSILKNVSQVLLLSNKWTGLFILIGLFLAKWYVGLAALIASILTYVLAKYMNFTEEEIADGLAGFNPVLTAIALTVFLEPTWTTVLLTLVATILTLPLAAALREFLKPYGVAMLTAPFVLMTWMTVLVAAQVKYVGTSLKLIPSTIEPIAFNQQSNYVEFFRATLEGFSQVFLEANIIGGLLILIGIIIASRKAAILAIIANIVGYSLVALLGGNLDDVNQGLFSYNFILVAIALGHTFKTAIHPYLSATLGVILTVIVQLGLTTLLEPFGLPALTMPFIITTWILLFAGRPHRPTPHSTEVNKK